MNDGPSTPPLADEDRPEPPLEGLEEFLAVWSMAWTSGYVSAGLSVAAARGAGPDELANIGPRWEHAAAHRVHDAFADPAARHVIVHAIEHALGHEHQCTAPRGAIQLTVHPQQGCGSDPS